MRRGENGRGGGPLRREPQRPDPDLLHIPILLGPLVFFHALGLSWFAQRDPSLPCGFKILILQEMLPQSAQHPPLAWGGPAANQEVPALSACALRRLREGLGWEGPAQGHWRSRGGLGWLDSVYSWDLRGLRAESGERNPYLEKKKNLCIAQQNHVSPDATTPSPACQA